MHNREDHTSLLSIMLQVEHLQQLSSAWHTTPLLLPEHSFQLSEAQFLELTLQRSLLEPGKVELYHPSKERSWFHHAGSETRALLQEATSDHMLILRQVQDLPEFQPLVTQLHAMFGGIITLNLYLNRSPMSGFPPHYDCHDLLIAQLLGEKEWELSAPTFSFPTSVDTSSPPQSYEKNIRLHKGELLYLPWGWWHRAAPQTSSIHMSIGIRHTPLIPLQAHYQG
jgi:hypothetical protein